MTIRLSSSDPLVQQALRRGRRQKYGNRKCEWEGERFDSQREMRAYQDLCLLVTSGDIRSLDRQVRYPLTVNGQRICTYVADFVIVWEDGREEVRDAKGYRTREYVIKRKLMKALHGIEIVEV